MVAAKASASRPSCWRAAAVCAAKPVGRLVHRLLDLAPRRGDQFGATLERGPALVIHLVVDLGSRSPRARVEFVRSDLCLASATLRPARGPNESRLRVRA